MFSNQLILDSNLKYSSQYRKELANHLPMALFALEKMGASPNRLIEFRDYYVKRLELKPSRMGVNIDADNWQEWLGKNKFHVEYSEYFSLCLAKFGLEWTLKHHLPILFNGVSGGAFHGLIRLGYALELDNLNEVSEALSYWAVSYLDLGVPDLGSGKKTPSQVLDDLSAEFKGFQTNAPNISRRLEAIGKWPQFQKICAKLDQSTATYRALAPFAISLFYQTQNFTALHGVTAVYASRIVSKYHSNFRALFIGLASAYVSIEAPPIGENLKIETRLSWKDLFEKAVLSYDDHIPKIIYTCYQEYCFHSNSIYLAAAEKYFEAESQSS
jgi:hypothetical protein